MERCADLLERFTKWLCVAMLGAVAVSLPLVDASFFEFNFHPLYVFDQGKPIEEVESWEVYPLSEMRLYRLGGMTEQAENPAKPGHKRTTVNVNKHEADDNQAAELLNESAELPRPPLAPLVAPQNVSVETKEPLLIDEEIEGVDNPR